MTSQKSGLQSYLNQFNNNNSRQAKAPSYLHRQNPQTWQTQFPNSQAQCINQLNRIKYKIKQEEDSITNYIKNYQQSVLRQLDSQYQVLRTEILKELDKTYEENKIKVRSGFETDNMNDMNGTIGDLRSLYLKIEGILRELQIGTTYKRGIAVAVMQDFENKRRIVVSKIRDALHIYEASSFLIVQPTAFNRIKHDIHSLFTYSGNSSNGFNNRGFESRGFQSRGFGETANFKQQFSSLSNQRQAPNIEINPSRLQPYNQRASLSNLKAPSTPFNTQMKKQPFSFQPSRAQQNERDSNSKLPNFQQPLKQSSAKQFRNTFASQFQQQTPNTEFVSSQVFPVQRIQSESAVLKVNPHRNRDLLKRNI